MAEQMKNIAEKVRAANKDWRQRVRNVLQDIQYDTGADILYVTFGKPADSFSIQSESEEEIYVRVKVDTYEIMGIDILNFRKSFLERHTEASEAFSALLTLFGTGDWRVQFRLPQEDEDGGLALYKPAARPPMEYVAAYVQKAAPELVPA